MSDPVAVTNSSVTGCTCPSDSHSVTSALSSTLQRRISSLSRRWIVFFIGDVSGCTAPTVHFVESHSLPDDSETQKRKLVEELRSAVTWTVCSTSKTYSAVLVVSDKLSAGKKHRNSVSSWQWVYLRLHWNLCIVQSISIVSPYFFVFSCVDSIGQWRWPTQ